VAKGKDEAAINDSGDAVVKAAEKRFDSRKTHNEESHYTTFNECVHNILFFCFKICPAILVLPAAYLSPSVSHKLGCDLRSLKP
jgi:hypothetical protein